MKDARPSVASVVEKNMADGKGFLVRVVVPDECSLLRCENVGEVRERESEKQSRFILVVVVVVVVVFEELALSRREVKDTRTKRLLSLVANKSNVWKAREQRCRR